MIAPSAIDTVVVPARKNSFQKIFLGQNMWHEIGIHSSKLEIIRYLAAYQTSPVSAITHVAEVISIKPWKDTQKFALYFKGTIKEIKPIPLSPRGRGAGIQRSRYTSYARLIKAKTLADLF
jgi:hypothetical protein